MGQLNDIKLLIETKIQADGLNAMDVKGKIGLRSGTLLAFIKPNTPDNPETINKLRQAVKEVLNLNV